MRRVEDVLERVAYLGELGRHGTRKRTGQVAPRRPEEAAVPSQARGTAGPPGEGRGEPPCECRRHGTLSPQPPSTPPPPRPPSRAHGAPGGVSAPAELAMNPRTPVPRNSPAPARQPPAPTPAPAP